MSGTHLGGLKASKTNKERYGDDFHKVIGRKGGKNSSNAEWARSEAGHEHLSKIGRKGGAISRRTK